MHSIKIINSDTRINVGKIVCVGRNFVEHAKELGNDVPKSPVIFLKPASALIHSGKNIIQPNFSSEMHFEAELVLLIGATIKNGNKAEAENAISGYGVGLDMTLRDLQSELKSAGKPWTLAKCFDTSAVVSDFVEKSNYKLNGHEKIKLSVNGVEKQNSSIDKMIFNSVELVKFISSRMTLEPGDLIFTGTPAGVDKVTVGDKIEASITNIGLLNTEIEK